MTSLRDLIFVGIIGSSISACYAYAGPPRQTYNPRRERVVVVHERRPPPVVVRERVVVREHPDHRDHRDHR